VGYTRTLSTAVWMGAPEGDVSMRNVNGVTVYGGTYPAQIWGSFHRKALADAEPVDFTAPDRSDSRAPKFLALLGEKAPPPERTFVDYDETPSERSSSASATPPAGSTATPAPTPTVPKPPTPPVVRVPEVTLPDIDALIKEAQDRALNPDRE